MSASKERKGGSGGNKRGNRSTRARRTTVATTPARPLRQAMTLAELNAAAGVEPPTNRLRVTRRTQVSTPDTARMNRQAERRAQQAQRTAHTETEQVKDPAPVAEAATEPKDLATAQVEETNANEQQPVVEETEDHTGALLAEHGSIMMINPFAVPEAAHTVVRHALPKAKAEQRPDPAATDESESDEVTSRRRRRRRRGDVDLELDGGSHDDPPNTVTRVRAPRASAETHVSNKVTSVRGSTRLEAKRQRRRESRETGRRRQVITEAEFLARRESVERQMIVRQREDRIQIGVLEDGVLAEHFVSKTQQDSLIGNVYLGKVQNVLPSMEAAFVDIGRGRNAVLYAGEVNWDVAGLEGQPRRIENALKAGDSVLVQVTKDPVGHKGARLTSQVSLPGRYLVYVPGGSMTGISRKLPDVERQRLKKILKDHLPENAGVIVRTAAEGASEEELMNDINRLRAQWEGIDQQATSTKTLAPELLYSEPDLTIKVVRDVFNEDFTKLIVSGEQAWDTIEAYVMYVAPDLLGRLEQWTGEEDIFAKYRIDEQINKALDRKVFLPSGGSLVIDRTEAMTVVDVNTGKFTGSGGNLEETVTKNNLEAAEEVVRQLRLRDIGGIIVIDFIDMVLEANRDLVLRRLVECLGRDRTKHQVAEVTSLGLVQMTRKRMGTGLLEVFGESCEHCAGSGVITHEEPVEHRKSYSSQGEVHSKKSQDSKSGSRSSRRRRGGSQGPEETKVAESPAAEGQDSQKTEATRSALASIAAASHLAEAADPAEGTAGAEAPASLEELEAVLPQGEGASEPSADSSEGGRPRKQRRRSRSRSRSGATHDEPAPDQSEDSAAAQPAAESRSAGRGPRRASSRDTGKVAAEQDQPVLTGLAMPSSGAQPAAEPVAAPVAAAPQSSTKPKRRSRRAVSAQGDANAEVIVGEVATASGNRVQMDTTSKPSGASAEPTAAPVMLGVGVPVRELKR
ncbi:Rne/Rng family ribonuclease [Glutamicibacter sp. MNS18]|uniref:Rne/Rng family ribonuclease n=1 Tax=Glutamicibacter sp. MNS18 TaxID=2989817 RepID=UPI002236AA03|nr:Rne/Rng family ribonuclease [Glutamicibacter sp. MNS18]MCW4464678.1 Rne/Rng family ribonuclease [Glutamicibacter sp. MNS18]